MTSKESLSEKQIEIHSFKGNIKHKILKEQILSKNSDNID